MNRFSERSLAHHRPRKICDGSVGFLVEEVAPSADTLTDQETNHHDVENGQEFHLLDLGDDQAAEQGADDAAVDRETAFVDIEQLVEVAAVVIPFEDTEIQPCADDAGDQSGKNTIHQLAGIDVVTRRALVAVHYGKQQADRDDQAVPINLEAAKLKRDAVDREVPSEKRKTNVKNIHIIPPNPA